MSNNFDLEELVEEKVKTENVKSNKLILYNDEVNSFEYVIACLTLVCDHSPIQAEQCALIAHHNGKCIIKEGSYLKLEKLKYELQDKELSVEIQ